MVSQKEYSLYVVKNVDIHVFVTDFRPIYVPTSTTVLSDNPAVALPLLTINGWILMQRKVKGGSVTFIQTWVRYRDGFGSPTGNDNYWLGLEKVYRLMQLGNVRLRIEVINQSINQSLFISGYQSP